MSNFKSIKLGVSFIFIMGQSEAEPLKCIGKEVAMKCFSPLRLEIKYLLVGVSKLINWCVGVLFLQQVYGI